MNKFGYFLGGMATMCAIGVFGSLYMARKDPETFDQTIRLYKGC